MDTLVILPVFDRNSIIQDALNKISPAIGNADILIIDDDSEIPIWEDFKSQDNIKCIRHSSGMGYGGCLITAIDYIQDHDYKKIFLADISEKHVDKALQLMMKEIDSCDIFNCSRIVKGLANDEEYSVYSIGKSITSKINSVTGLNIADIFSPFKGFKREVFDKILIEEFDEAAVLQIWVQAAHYKFTVKELHCADISRFEIDDISQVEMDDDYYLTFIEGEVLMFPVEESKKTGSTK